jgi:hypothetical protein
VNRRSAPPQRTHFDWESAQRSGGTVETGGRNAGATLVGLGHEWLAGSIRSIDRNRHRKNTREKGVQRAAAVANITVMVRGLSLPVILRVVVDVCGCSGRGRMRIGRCHRYHSRKLRGQKRRDQQPNKAGHVSQQLHDDSSRERLGANVASVRTFVNLSARKTDGILP